MKTSKHKGWTLLELLTICTILSVTATLALPYWNNIIGKFRVQSAVNQFTSNISHARSEAIRRANSVVIQRRDDCIHRDWSCGWFSFEDINANLVLDEEEFVIRMFDPPGGVQVSTNASGLRQRLRITPRGTSQGVSAASFFFNQSHGEQCTRLVISAGLRWRTEQCQ